MTIMMYIYIYKLSYDSFYFECTTSYSQIVALCYCFESNMTNELPQMIGMSNAQQQQQQQQPSPPPLGGFMEG